MMRATEVVFMPGFDGVAALRRPFLDALGKRFPVRPLTYPNRTLESLNGYSRFAASQVPQDARPVLVAESFSGLVAARWASRDPHVAGLVLCAAFARNPMPWMTSLAASLPGIVQLGAHLFPPIAATYDDPLRRQWGKDLSATLRTLEAAVIAERLRLIAREDVEADLRALGIPVVLLQFEGDLVVGPQARRALEAACPGAVVSRIAGPHFALETMPQACAEAIAAPLAPLF